MQSSKSDVEIKKSIPAFEDALLACLGLFAGKRVEKSKIRLWSGKLARKPTVRCLQSIPTWLVSAVVIKHLHSFAAPVKHVNFAGLLKIWKAFGIVILAGNQKKRAGCGASKQLVVLEAAIAHALQARAEVPRIAPVGGIPRDSKIARYSRPNPSIKRARVECHLTPERMAHERQS